MNQSVPLLSPFLRLKLRAIAAVVGLVFLGVSVGLAILGGVLAAAQALLGWVRW